MEIINAVQIVLPVPDSQFRVKNCCCGDDQPVYIQGNDDKWRVMCLTCGKETAGFKMRHDAQASWNRRDGYGRT